MDGRRPAPPGKARYPQSFDAKVKVSGAPRACRTAKEGIVNAPALIPRLASGEHLYLDLLREVLETGAPCDDRTGVGTLSVFGRQIRFDLADGFPLLTTKKVHFRSVVLELAWFLAGSTNVHWLQERGCSIWDEWADADGELGPVYGRQWRSWAAPDGRVIDQITRLIDGLRRSPQSRRHIVSAWNPADVDDMALPPCHCLFQFHVSGERLSCQLYQRSADLFLGVPFNIASYALLTHLVAKVVGLQVGEFVHTFGDAHIYLNHREQAALQLSREPRPFPELVLPDHVDLFDLDWAGIKLAGYRPHPAISAPVAV